MLITFTSDVWIKKPRDESVSVVKVPGLTVVVLLRTFMRALGGGEVQPVLFLASLTFLL